MEFFVICFYICLTQVEIAGPKDLFVRAGSDVVLRYFHNFPNAPPLGYSSLPQVPDNQASPAA